MVTDVPLLFEPPVLGVVVDRLLDPLALQQLADVALEQVVVERVGMVEVARFADRGTGCPAGRR